jgi:hypothetical protein
LRELLGSLGARLDIRERVTDFVYPTRDYMLEHYRSWFGPTAVQFAQLDPEGQERFAADLLGLYAEWNRADDGTVCIPAAYLEVVATKE